MSSSLLFSVVFSNISRNSTRKEILLYLVSFNARRSQLIHFCIQCVAQFPAGTSFRPKKIKLCYFRWDFNSSSTEAIPQKNKHLRYQLMVLVGFLVEKRANKNGFCSGE